MTKLLTLAVCVALCLMLVVVTVDAKSSSSHSSAASRRHHDSPLHQQYRRHHHHHHHQKPQHHSDDSADAPTDATDELPKLPNFSGTTGNIYVTGVSSGGYMAGQLHVAYSSIIAGAGIMAAGPWGCATGLLEKALSACTDDSEPIGLPDILAAAQTAAAIGTIDPLSNLQNAPVWLFHGESDATVKKSVSDAAAVFYNAFQSDVLYNNATQANHAWISPLGANPCTVSDSPYTSQCGTMDPQYEMLSHIMRRQIQPSNQGQLTGSLTAFSQDFYTYAKWGLPASMLSMDSTGYLYVPAACQSNGTGTQSTCDIVLVLHGCEQSISLVGQDLINQANMNQYADTNNFIILYPQAIALDEGVVLNPKSCWDWWAYLDDDELYANKGGYQNSVLMSMVAALANPIQ